MPVRTQQQQQHPQLLPNDGEQAAQRQPIAARLSSVINDANSVRKLTWTIPGRGGDGREAGDGTRRWQIAFAGRAAGAVSAQYVGTADMRMRADAVNGGRCASFVVPGLLVASIRRRSTDRRATRRPPTDGRRRRSKSSFECRMQKLVGDCRRDAASGRMRTRFASVPDERWPAAPIAADLDARRLRRRARGCSGSLSSSEAGSARRIEIRARRLRTKRGLDSSTFSSTGTSGRSQ
jgi:hypothetical protein